MEIMPSAQSASALKIGSTREAIERYLPEEVPVSVVCNGTSVAVLMATPDDLEDFAIGFCFSEGIIDSIAEIESLEIVEHDAGIELRLWIAQLKAARLLARRRHNAGPTGCGLCGIESLQEASRTLPSVSDIGTVVDASMLLQAVQALREHQHLNAVTRAVHAAAAWSPTLGFGPVREDVGRHNALDKVIGALLRERHEAKVVLLTSRVSIELIQKAAMAGVAVLAAVSVPTALAVRVSEACGITLVGVARDDGFEVFTHGHRITQETL